METVMKASEFSANNIEYTELRAMGTTGAKSMYLNYSGGQRIVLHTPKMRLPYGIGKYEEPGKPPKYSLDLSFANMESDPKIKAFYDAIHSIDEKIIADTKKNSLAWLRKKTVSEDVARTLYTPSVKHSKDKETGEITDKYPPTFKVKIPFWENQFTCNVFDHEKKKLEGDWTENISKGQSVMAIIKCGGVWFSGGKYGVSWQLHQLKLVGQPNNLIGYAFRDEEDED